MKNSLDSLSFRIEGYVSFNIVTRKVSTSFGEILIFKIRSPLRASFYETI